MTSEKSSIADTREAVSSQHDTTSDERLPLLKAVRRYPKVVGWIFGTITGLLFCGFDTVIVGTITALPWFQRDFGEPTTSDDHSYILPAMWVALWSALGPVGAVLSSIVAGWLQDRIGRKRSLTVACCVGIIAITIMYISNLAPSIVTRRGVFLVSKLLQGASVGMILATSQTYISEIAPVSLRGPAMALFPTFTLLGQLAGALVIFGMSTTESSQSYLMCFASQWPFVALPLVVSVFMPESPTWLLQREHIDDARQSLTRLHSQAVDVATILGRISDSVALDTDQAKQTSYLHCFQGSNRRRTTIIILASSVINLFGLPLLANASYFMQQVGMAATTSLMFLIIGIVLGFLANGVGIWLMSKVGRRPLTNITMGLTTILWMAMGIAGIWNSPVTVWYTACSLMVIVVVCGIGCWPASFAVQVETSTLRLRARSQGIAVISSQIGNIVIQLVLPYIYNSDAGDLGAKTGFVYGGLCAIGTVLCWLMIPEMKDRTVVDIDRMFELSLPTRAFKGFVSRPEPCH